MAEQFIQLPPNSTGLKVRTFEQTVGANVVEHQAFVLCDSNGNIIGSLATAPVGNEQGLIVRPIQGDAVASGTITTTDAVVAAPAGDGTLRTGASTAGSLVALACPGGDSAWNCQVTGLTSGTLYFETSLDSTNGTDGNWTNVNGRQTGVVNTVLAGNTTTNGYFRGNTSGSKWMRVRSVGALTGTPGIILRISAGIGAIFLNASIPAGTNSIGGVTGTPDKRYGGGKSSIGGQLSTAGDNVVLTPAAGKAITVYWVSIIPAPDDTSSNLFTVKFSGGTVLYTGYAMGHWEVFTAPINNTLIINLANTQPVAYTVHYTVA